VNYTTEATIIAFTLSDNPRKCYAHHSLTSIARSRSELKPYRCKEAYMNASVIGKIEKAKRYAEEKVRVTFDSFVPKFRGENGDHRLEYGKGTWPVRASSSPSTTYAVMPSLSSVCLRT
jgi:hypothetical protein